MRAGEGRDAGPQPLVEARALGGSLQQSLGAGIGRGMALGLQAGGFAQGAGLLGDLVGALPGGLFGVAEDRPQGEAEAGTAAPFGGGAANLGDGLADLGLGLAPQGVDVGVLAGDRDGGVRGAAEIDRQVAALIRLHRPEGGLHLIVFAAVVERSGAGPFLAHDVEVFLGAGVALVLGQVIAVLAHLVIGATGDDVDGDTAAGELVEGGQLTRRYGGGGEARTVSDHETEAPGHRGGVGHDQLTFGCGGAERHQSPIEPAVVVRLGGGLDEVGVEDRTFVPMGFRARVGADEANELDGHGGLQSDGLSLPGQRRAQPRRSGSPGVAGPGSRARYAPRTRGGTGHGPAVRERPCRRSRPGHRAGTGT